LNQNIQIQINTLSQNLQAIIKRIDQASHESSDLGQRLNQELKNQLQLQVGTLSRDLQAIIGKLEKNFTDAKELGNKLATIKDNFSQMNCDSRDMNQNIRQIRVFFEQIERHLDLKK